MEQVTRTNFGLLIAYLIPGFIALVGMSFLSDTIRAWLVGHDAVTIGGFLYSTIAAMVVGLMCSTVRWIAIDTLHHRTGIRRPEWNFADLQENLEAYLLLEENHYRYYQFYGNSLIAWAIGYGSWRYSVTDRPWQSADLAFMVIAMLLYLGSRDTLRLCVRPHKLSYVVESVMWPRTESSSIPCAVRRVSDFGKQLNTT